MYASLCMNTYRYTYVYVCMYDLKSVMREILDFELCLYVSVFDYKTWLCMYMYGLCVCVWGVVYTCVSLGWLNLRC